MNTTVTLLIPEKTDIEFDEVLAIWTGRGGHIKRLGKYWIKDEELVNKPIAIYGNQTFSLILAQIYNVELISCDDTLIARLDSEWIKRSIQQKTIKDLEDVHFPVFIKPVIPKLFLAGVFQHLSEFKAATSGLADTEELLLSTIVNINAEARSYIMKGEIKDIALYEGAADLEAAKVFLLDFVAHNKDLLPLVVVVDLAFDEALGWFVLEFNACWGAGLNSCKAEKVIDCIISATKQKI